MQNKKLKRRGIKIVAAFIGIMFVFGICVFWGATKSIPETKANIQTLEKIRLAMNNDSKLVFSADDLNYLISFLMPNGIEKNSAYIKGAFTKLSNGKLYLYVPIKYKGISVLVSAKNELSYENGILSIKPLGFMVGLVPIPKNIVMNYLKNRMGERVKLVEGNILVKTDSLSIDIKAMEIKDNTMVVELPKSNISTNLERIIDEENIKYSSVDKNISNNEKISTSSKSSTKSNTSTKGSNTKKLGSSERTKILSKAKSQLSVAAGKVNSAKAKQIIIKAESAINSMISNPGYNYQGDLYTAKVIYDKLTDAEKEKLKAAIFQSVDTKSLLKIYTGNN